MTAGTSEWLLCDYQPSMSTFREDVLSGLRQAERRLPCKYFYDERGSRLFDEICTLDEYYLTRTELAIMQSFGSEMAAQIDAGVMLVEYGSGSSVKTRILLDHLPDPVAYVPVDISHEHLRRTSAALWAAYPHIEVLPVCADFTEEFQLPASKRRPTHCAVYFPGSTIGNFDPDAARVLLGRIAPLCGEHAGLLIGIDLQKDTPTIEAAYNDQGGVTAQFTLNLLARINRELDGNFQLDQFEHLAFYNSQLGRIETYLVSERDQKVRVADESFDFRAQEAICTEYSYKYTVAGFAQMAADVGLMLRREWTDEKRRFAVLHFAVTQ